MWKRRRAQGLIAKSLHEELSSDERLFLDRYLESDPALKRDAESVSAFLAKLPKDDPSLDIDLLPRLNALIEERSARRMPVMRFAMVGSLCLVLVLAGALVLLRNSHDALPKPEVAAVIVSPLTEPMADAQNLIGNGDYTAAYTTLTEAVAAYPSDQFAGDAQLLIADLALTRLHWYDKAYLEYERLWRDYNVTFVAHPRLADIRDLLAEARIDDFESLRALEAARENRTDPYSELEKVIVRYPERRLLASEAVAEMARLALQNEEVPANTTTPLLHAMTWVRDRCTEPMAVAQLNYEIGHVYQNELHDAAQARASFLKASEHPALKQAADTALARLAPSR